MDYDFSAQRTSRRYTPTTRSRRKRFPWWITLGIALVLMVALVWGVKALADHLADSAFGEKNRAESPPSESVVETVTESPAPRPEPRDPLSPPPGDITIPSAVNAFLQSEYLANAERCMQIEDGLGLPLVEGFSVVFCRPVWDYRTPSRDVLWFYAYTGAVMNDKPCVVFGVVDENGASLFQHPSLENDPLALLESRYQNLEWIALDEPHSAVIAAMNGPWEECGATVDLFPLNGPPIIRVDDQDDSDDPTGGDQWISFHDVNGDGFRDLSILELTPSTGGAPSDAEARLYDPTTKTYRPNWQPLGEPVVAILHSNYQKSIDSEEANTLGFVRPGRLLNLTGPSSEEVITPPEDD